ncbi:MAG: S-layer family protein [Rubrivivax sp.]|nr:S-layer family protein [Rubrivivax sp.]
MPHGPRQGARRADLRTHRRNDRRVAPRLRRLALAAAIAAGSAPAWGIDYVWLGGSGDWLDPGRWSPAGTPGAGDGVTLGSGTATLDVDRVIDSLTMTGGNRAGTGTLTTGGLSFSSGSLTGAGVTTATSTTSFVGTANQTINSNHVLALAGGATWSAGNGSINAQTGGSLRLAAATGFFDAGAATAGGTRFLGFGNGGFINAGTYERNGLGTTNAYAFENTATGTLNVNAGTLNFASASSSSGVINVAGGALLSFGGGNSTVSGSIANAGLVRLSAGTLTMTGSIGGDVHLDFGTFNNDSVNTLGRLQVTGGTRSGSAALQVASLEFNNGTFNGGATTTVFGITTFNGGVTQTVNSNHVLQLNGDAFWSAGDGSINATSSGSLRVAASATFEDAGAASAAGTRFLGFGSGGFHNAGTYERNGLGTTNAYAFENTATGTLNVNAGTLNFASASSSSGVINVAGGALLSFGGGNSTVSGSIANAGLVRLSAGTLTMTGSIGGDVHLDFGTFNNNSVNALGQLQVTGGTRAGSAALQVASLEFNNGTFSGSATTTVFGITNFNGSTTQTVNSNHVLQLNGDAFWTAGDGSINVQTGGSIRVAATATFEDAGAASAASNRYLAFGTGGFENTGTFTRNGLGTTNAYGFDNTGTIHLNAGTLRFATASHSSGSIDVAAGTQLNFGGGNSTVSGSIANAGLVRLSAGTLTMTGSIGGDVHLDFGTFNNDSVNALGQLQVTGGTRAGSAALQVASLEFNNGTFSGGATTTVFGITNFNGSVTQTVNSNHVLQLGGDAFWTAGDGSINVQTGGNVRVAAGATFEDAGAASAAGDRYLGFGNGGFHNAGTYERNGLGTTNAYRLVNTGTVNVNAGTLAVNADFDNTGLVHVKPGAVLAATGTGFANAGVLAGDGLVRTLGASWALSNAGTIAPGAPASTGILTVDGDLRLLGAGTLEIHLSSLASFDLLAVTDDLTVGGTLHVANLGYTPVVGDEFVIVSFAQRLQDSVFDSVTWSGFGSGVQFGVVYNANDITLGVLAVPEPATWALWLAGVAGLAAMRRRRMRGGA